jgi:hypothetical protein
MSSLLNLLDQTQKLFGRALAVAGLTPALIGILTITTAVRGLPYLRRVYESWILYPSRAAFDLGLLIVGSYLLGYTIYGIRGFLRSLYEGSWRRPQWLIQLRVDRQIKRCRRLERVAMLRLDANNVLLWITTRGDLEEEFGDKVSEHEGEAKDFTDAVTERLLKQREGSRVLARTERRWRKLKSSIDRSHSPRIDRRYTNLLIDAHCLQANSSSRLQNLQSPIASLVESIASQYRDHPSRYILRSAVKASLERRWAHANAIRESDYPELESLVQPTRFGNVLAAGESRTIQRYNISAEFLWPRLTLLANNDLSSVNEANTYVDFTINMALLSVLVTAAGAAICIYNSKDFTYTALFVPIGGLLGFIIFSRLAIGAARAWVSEIAANIDMHRLDLIDSLRLIQPVSVEAEQDLWEDVNLFFNQGTFRDGRKLPLRDSSQPSVSECLIRLIPPNLAEKAGE